MVMADGRWILQRCSFEIQSNGSTVNTFNFTINPQNIVESTASRTFIQQTRNSGTVQRFGVGVKNFTLSGTTGWRHGSGIDELYVLKDFMENYMNNFADNVQTDYTFIFHNYTDNYSYIVEFAEQGISFTQDVSKPLLTTYNIQFVAVQPADQATSSDINKTTLGNDASSLGGGSNNNGYVNPNVSTKAVSLAYNQLTNSLGT